MNVLKWISTPKWSFVELFGFSVAHGASSRLGISLQGLIVFFAVMTVFTLLSGAIRKSKLGGGAA